MIELDLLNIIPLISFILYTIIFVVIRTSQRTKLANAFSLYVVAMMIWSFGSFLMKTDVPPSSLFWNKVMQIGFISVPLTLLRFSYRLTDESDRNLLVKIGTVLVVGLIILAWTDNVIDYVSYADGDLEYTATWGVYLVAVFGIVYSMLAFGIMVKKTIKGEISLNKTGLVQVGLFLVVLGGALNISPTIGKYGFDILLNTFNALLITYAIYRYKFLEINLLVKRGLSFSLSNILLFFIYAFLIVSTYRFLTIRLGVTDKWLTLLYMSPLFLVLEPIRATTNSLVQRLFYSGQEDRQQVLEEFSSLINTKLNLDHVTTSLVNSITKAIDVKKCHLFLRRTHNYYLQASTNNSVAKEKALFKLSHPVVKWFEKDETLLLKTHVDKHIHFKGLWESEKALLTYLSMELIIPIHYAGSLIGFVVLSEKNDETPFSFEEIAFLKTLLNNAAAIIENAKTLENMRVQTITDELTKFYNHRHFQEIASDWISNKKYARFGLAIVDIDQFRIYNELYGHASGDEVLKRIANIIRRKTRKQDLLVRYGGEEFAILFPEYDRRKTHEASEKIRGEVESEFLRSNDIREFITVTIGFVAYDEDGTQLEVLINKASKAVLQGKRSGRNKAVAFSEEVDEESLTASAQIKDAFVSSIYALAATIDAKDRYTYGHSNNVAILSEALARRVGFSDKDVEIVKNAGLLHDIGKVGIPESVLLKPGYLTPKEYEIMKGHVLQSVNIIRHIPNLIETIPVVISHHERFDGKGYPRGLKGEQIPLLGRVICIADSFDAMTTDRPYRKGLTLKQALYELQKNAGKQFDPNLIKTFMEIAEDGTLEKLSLQNRPTFK